MNGAEIGVPERDAIEKQGSEIGGCAGSRSRTEIGEGTLECERTARGKEAEEDESTRKTNQETNESWVNKLSWGGVGLKRASDKEQINKCMKREICCFCFVFLCYPLHPGCGTI